MENQINKTTNEIFKDINSYKPKQRVPKKVLDRNDFMLLFVKQLEYQDPMHPLENNEMATQLALFNQLDELYSLNEKFDKLINITKDSNFYQFVSLVGKLVDTEGEEVVVEDGQFLGAKILLEEPVSDLKIKISSPEKGTVKIIDLGALSPGEYNINWDATDKEGNKVGDGIYNVSIETIGNQNFEGKLIVTGKITSVSFKDNDNITFKINGNNEIEPNEILAIKENSFISHSKEENNSHQN